MLTLLKGGGKFVVGAFLTLAVLMFIVIFFIIGTFIVTVVFPTIFCTFIAWAIGASVFYKEAP